MLISCTFQEKKNHIIMKKKKNFIAQGVAKCRGSKFMLKTKLELIVTEAGDFLG